MIIRCSFLLLLNLILFYTINGKPENIALDKQESLTNKYINSLREGKWGASDPSWVKKDIAKKFFPNVTKLGRLEGDPPTVSVFNKGELLGYLFVYQSHYYLFCL